MLDIRKAVYEREKDGTAMGELGGLRKSPAFAMTSGLHKVRMIKEKQQEILAGLVEAEADALLAFERDLADQ